MASVPQTEKKPEDVRSPDQATAHVVSPGSHPSAPSLSSPTPTPSIVVGTDAKLDFPALEEPAPLPEIVVHPPEGPTAPDVSRQPPAAPATRRTSARRATSSGNASGMLKALGKQRVRSAAFDRIGGRVVELGLLVRKIMKGYKLFLAAPASMLHDLYLPPPSRMTMSVPKAHVLAVTALVSNPAAVAAAMADKLQEHVNGLKADIEKMETVLKEIEADAKGLKLEGELDVANWVERAGVRKGIKVQVYQADEMLQLFAAACAQSAAVEAEPVGETL
ncbi:hypothetical protein TRAPUB_963 [Trametes pubescens]|uniref:Uncharacterized protein n=1 Tax=Trametes pubescens TaxID=154538 RepID=A0A1M2VKP2_TRAPU|nr:hypothetical protein TRAPUB_963 [Trametes pubescens]